MPNAQIHMLSSKSLESPTTHSTSTYLGIDLSSFSTTRNRHMKNLIYNLFDQ